MKIQSQQVKELREKTGAGILACKKALQKSEGDIEGAIDILRADGVAKAAKRESKEAREGVIRLKIDTAGKKAALLELNCETDFVARTDDFLKLADELLEAAFMGGRESLEPEETSARVTSVAVQIGEKITPSRGLTRESDGFIGGYLHHNYRVAALVELSIESPTVAREIAMQVAASNPPYLSEADISAEEKEREFEIFRQQVKDKPEAIREKIIIGKWRKRLTELCLLNLPFLHDDKISVGEYLKKQADPSGEPIEIKDFVRWQLGE